MNPERSRQLDRLMHRLSRRSDLLRGRWLRLRGASAGVRFGVGQRTTVLCPSSLQVGDDVAFSESSYLNCSGRGVSIGAGSSFDRNLWLDCGGDIDVPGEGFFTIGPRSYVGANAVIGAGAGVAIGADVLVGQSVNFHSELHRFDQLDRPIRAQGVGGQGIIVEDDVWIGAQVVVLDGVTIGQGAVIGAGSVVTRSIPPLQVAVGVPAKSVRSRGATEPFEDLSDTLSELPAAAATAARRSLR